MIVVAGVEDTNIVQQSEIEQVQLNIRTISRDLRRRFRVFCAERDMRMEPTLIRLIEMVVDGDVPPEMVDRLEFFAGLTKS